MSVHLNLSRHRAGCPELRYVNMP